MLPGFGKLVVKGYLEHEERRRIMKRSNDASVLVLAAMPCFSRRHISFW
jgi:hypothetical protein